jgi:hypothetical protein
MAAFQNGVSVLYQVAQVAVTGSAGSGISEL